MAKATCRCGQLLTVADDRDGRVICPKCGAKVRVRSTASAGSDPSSGDGYIRFFCACGRRLKVPVESPPSHGKCPDCGKVVPVPTGAGPGAGVVEGPEQRTEELLADEARYLEQWSAEHRDRGSRVPSNVPSGPNAPPSTLPQSASERVEAGLRMCPTCSRPVHLGAEVCRHCGTSVPRR